MVTRRRFLGTGGACAGALALGWQPTRAAEPAAAPTRDGRPNFVIFLTDDQPQNGLSCYGNPHIRTPNMDRLAAEGTLFENAFVTTSISCCSRASFLTGQHMRRHGIRDFERALTAEQLAQTFPVLLRQAGYRTAFLGKFAVGGGPKQEPGLCLPADRFDLWYGFPQSIAFKQTTDGRERYLTTVMEEKAVQFIRENKAGAPFCLIVALKEPHGPLDYFDPEYANPYTTAEIPPPANMTGASFEALPPCVREGLNGGSAAVYFRNPARRLENIRRIYAYISRADLAVGRILAALRENGADDNTVVMHTSDNGSFEGAHGLVGKWLMYEESIRVPLLVRDPRLGGEGRGRRCPEMALNIDVAPTVLAMAGVAVPPRMQGLDLRPFLTSTGAPGREEWYYEHTYNTPPTRRPIPATEGVRTRRWKYVRYTSTQPVLEQLFDLETDPQEEKDLAREPEQAGRLQELRARCDGYRASLA